MTDINWSALDQAVCNMLGQTVTMDDGVQIADGVAVRVVLDKIYRAELFGGRAGESAWSCRFATADWPDAKRGHRVTTAAGVIHTLDERGELADQYTDHWWIR